MTAPKKPYEGHRDRMRDRFIEEGLDSLYDHEVVELLLYYAIPRKDTNEIAHRLMNRFGSLSAFFDTPLEALQEAGLSYSTAVLIKMIPALCSRYYRDRYEQEETEETLDSTEKTKKLIMPYFIGKTEEQAVLVLFDNKGKRIFCDVMYKGRVTVPEVLTRKVARLCVQHQASAAILARNHSNGIALPKERDKALAVMMRDILRRIGVIFLDFFIIGEAECCAMSELEDCENLFF